MRISSAGLNIIKSHEGWRANAYPDPASGGDPWTIGYGHTSMAGPPVVSKGMKITKAEGERILRDDVRKFEKAVNDAVTVELTQNQFDALVSFTFNVGPGNLRKSSVLRNVNLGRFKDVPRSLSLWNKAAGKVMPGLTRRRGEEGALFATPVIGNSRIAVSQRVDVPVDVPVGKSMVESTTNMAAVAGTATGAVSAFAGLEFRVACLVAALLVLFAGYIIWERHKKSKHEAI